LVDEIKLGGVLLNNRFELDGFVFQNRNEFAKAKKELEAIAYIRSNSDLNNATLVLKIYDKLLDKGTFQTVVGYMFLKELRETILEDSTISKGKVRSIPIKFSEPAKIREKEEDRCAEAKRADMFQELYEKEKVKKISTKIVIGFLVCIIIGMLVAAQFTPYSLFTNYEDKIINKYENWQKDLEQKEAQLEQREQALLDKEQ